MIKTDEEIRKLVDRLLPPDWNPREEELEELEAEYAIAADADGWERIEKGWEEMYLEELQAREAGAKLA